MKKLEIVLTEEQFKVLSKEIIKLGELNFKEETFSGFGIKLNVIEGGISWLEFKGYNSVDIGEVEWDIKE